MFTAENNGTKTWVAAIIHRCISLPPTSPTHNSIAMLEYVSMYLQRFNGIPNEFILFADEQRIPNQTPLDKLFMEPTVELPQNLSGTTPTSTPMVVDVMVGFWAYSAARHQLAHLSSHPYSVSGIGPLSLNHFRPLSLWLLADVFSPAAWVLMIFHLSFLSVILYHFSKNENFSSIFIKFCRLFLTQDFSYHQSYKIICGWILWFGLVTQIFFSSELLTYLVRREGDNVDFWESALDTENFLPLISAGSFTYNVLLKDWIAENADRYRTFAAYVPTLNLFFSNKEKVEEEKDQRRKRRHVLISYGSHIDVVTQLYPQIDWHRGDESRMTPFGWLLNRVTVPAGSRLLAGFELALATALASGMVQHLDSRDNLLSRNFLVDQRRNLGAGQFSVPVPLRSETDRGQNFFRPLSFLNLRLAFGLLLFPVIVPLVKICLQFAVAKCKQKSETHVKVGEPPTRRRRKLRRLPRRRWQQHSQASRRRLSLPKTSYDHNETGRALSASATLNLSATASPTHYWTVVLHSDSNLEFIKPS